MAEHRYLKVSLRVRGFLVGERHIPEMVCLKLRRGLTNVGLYKLAEVSNAEARVSSFRRECCKLFVYNRSYFFTSS